MTARSATHCAARRDMPRGWIVLLLTLGSWAALIGSALLVHAIVMAGVMP